MVPTVFETTSELRAKMETRTERFTPGPWSVSYGQSVIFIITAEGKNVAGTNTKRYYEQTDATDEANARLIAAAPDMHKALLAIREWLLFTDTITKEDAKFWAGAFVKANNLAVAALAKASTTQASDPPK